MRVLCDLSFHPIATVTKETSLETTRGSSGCRIPRRLRVDHRPHDRARRSSQEFRPQRSELPNARAERHTDMNNRIATEQRTLLYYVPGAPRVPSNTLFSLEKRKTWCLVCENLCFSWFAYRAPDVACKSHVFHLDHPVCCWRLRRVRHGSGGPGARRFGACAGSHFGGSHFGGAQGEGWSKYSTPPMKWIRGGQVVSLDCFFCRDVGRQLHVFAKEPKSR